MEINCFLGVFYGVIFAASRCVALSWLLQVECSSPLPAPLNTIVEPCPRMALLRILKIDINK